MKRLLQFNKTKPSEVVIPRELRQRLDAYYAEERRLLAALAQTSRQETPS
jgi:hypothetical protein